MSVAIIAEYNPFHNGHIFQLKTAKKRFPNEKIIVILSGKYVQRGEIAIASYYKRKKMALKYGADKVIKLPFNYATQAAHIFAHGAIKIVAKHKIDKLFFGSESNDPANLLKIAQITIEQKKAYDQLVKANLKKGNSFPKASADALKILSNQAITLPNDILGLEYCKAIIKDNLPIKVFTLKRTIPFHNLEPHNNFASASYLRTMIYQKHDISLYSPMVVKKYKRIEDFYPQFQKIVKKTKAKDLKKIKLISEGMENLFKKHIDAPTYQEFVARTNSKRYTSSRIKRVMLYVLLKKNK